MKVEVIQGELAQVEADLLVVGLYDGEALPGPLAETSGAAEVRPGSKKTALLRPQGHPPVLTVGLGESEEVETEKLRVAAAIAAKRAEALEAASLAWAVPNS